MNAVDELFAAIAENLSMLKLVVQMKWGILCLDILDANGVYYKLNGYETVKLPKLTPVRDEDVEDGIYYYWNGLKFVQIPAECVRMREAWKKVAKRRNRR